jgi:hypothetical protein
MFKKTIIGAAIIANAGALSAYPADIYNNYNTPVSTGYYSQSDYTFRGCGLGCRQLCLNNYQDQPGNYDQDEGRMTNVRTSNNDRTMKNDNRYPNDTAIDDDIELDVEDALNNDASISDQSRIEVNVEDGVVSLTGTVPTSAEKSRAESVAKNVKGVEEVNNQLTVSNQ